MKWFTQITIVCTGVMVFTLFTCSKIDQQQINVAKVNDRSIPASEFRQAYEYAPSTVTRAGLRESYDSILGGIIDRLLLAEVGYKKGYDSDTNLRKIVDYYKRAAITRELFLRHVRDSVNVVEDEIRLAYEQQKTTLIVKHYVFPNRIAIERGLNDITSLEHTPMSAYARSIEHPEFGHVDLVGWNEHRQELEQLLFSLDPGQPSPPIHDRGSYHVYIVVDWEKDAFLTENDYLSQRESLVVVIRKRKEHHMAYKFVSRIMSQQNLHFKAAGLTQLVEHLANIYNDIPSELRLQQTAEIPNLIESESDLLSQPLAIFGDLEWTIGDFLFYYELKPLPIKYDDQAYINNSVRNSLAIYARDFVLSEQGIAEGLADMAAVKQEERNWTEQLLANLVRRDLATAWSESMRPEVGTTSEFKPLFSAYLDSLRIISTITIDSTKLYSITTSASGQPRKIDFVSTLLP